MIYFVQEDEPGRDRIKIGYTAADDVMHRVKDLQTGSPSRLKVIAVMNGGIELEAFLHRLFHQFRLRREWFSNSPVIMEYVERHATPFVMPVPEPKGEYGDDQTWVEFPMSGTRNRKRYAVRRKWQVVNGQRRKVTIGRVKEIPPMTEEEYQRYITADMSIEA